MNKTILPAKTRTIGPYSQGIKVEAKELVFISGQVPEDEGGNVVGKGNVKVQAKQVMENLKAIAKGAKEIIE